MDARLIFNSSIGRRTVSALVLVPAALVILCAPWAALTLACLGVLVLLMLVEWQAMLREARGRRGVKRLALVGASYIVVSSGILACWVLKPALFPLSLLTFFVLLWANDIGAYGVGRWIGGRKLAPRISPGKTWSGLIGGVIAGIVTLLIWAHWNDRFKGEELAGFIVLVVGTSLAGHAGDLLESAAKRFCGVKDSGTLIPGHGGVLDRLDSALGGALFIGLYAALKGL